MIGDDGREEVLSEYLCDWPDCPNVAEHLLGFARELRQVAAICREHAQKLRERASPNGRP